MSKKEQSVKKYNLALPANEFEKVQAIAEENSTTMLNVLLKFCELGLEIHKATHNGGAIIKKEGDKEIELLIIS